MKKFDYISSFVLFVLAVVLFFQSRNLAVWGELGPSEGFFPLMLSFLLALLSLISLIRTYFQIKQDQEAARILGPKKINFLIYIASFFAFGLFFEKLGYYFTLAAFLILTIKIVEKQSWKMTLGVTVVSLAASYLIFVKFLLVPLPEGILSFVVQLLR